MARDLEGVKPGDKLKVSYSWSSQYEEYTVERVTKTRAVCNRGASFMIDTGLEIGTRGNSKYASFLTESDIDRASRERRIKETQRAIHAFNVNAANLEAAEAFIEASQPKAGG